MHDSQPKIEAASVNISAVATVTAYAYTVTNYAIPHLQAAARFSRRVGEVEATNHETELGAFWDEIRHCASACVMLAVAAVESYANEDLFALKPQVAAIPVVLRGRIDRLPLRDKFDLVLALLDRPAFDWGRGVGQELVDVIKLRDAVVHFKPERSDEQDEHATLSKRLGSRFEPSRYFPASEEIFPRRWCSHSCTKWVVETCLQFGAEFEKASGLPAKLGKRIGHQNVAAQQSSPAVLLNRRSRLSLPERATQVRD